MKKVLSFVLVLAMILGTVSMAFAAAPVSGVKVTAANTAKPFADAPTNMVTTVLRDLGAVEGDENGNVNVAANITRAEAATIIVRAMGLGDQGAVKTTTKFTDVKKTDWFSGYVAVAAANGFMDGVGNGKFDPNGLLTMDQAVTLMLKVLGYDAAHLKGTWPMNYRDLALAKSGVLDKVVMDGTNATRGDFFQVLYNCLDQTIVVWKETTVSGEFKEYVDANFKLYKKMTRTQGSIGDYGKAVNLTITEDTEFVNGFDASAYYGMKADLIIKKVDGKDYYIGIASVAGVILEGTFASTDATTFKAIDGTIYTLKDGLTFVSGASTFINGVAGGTFAQKKDVTYKIGVTLDKTYTTVITGFNSVEYWTRNGLTMITASQAAILAQDTLYMDGTKISAAALKTATDKGILDYVFPATIYAIDSSKRIVDEAKVVVEGAATKLSEIKENDIVAVYCATGNAASAVTKLVVTRNVVEGTVSQYNQTANTVVVGGTTYKFDPAANVEINDAAKYASASTHAVYLTAEGKIAYITIPGIKAVKPVVKYAFVRATGYTPAQALYEIDAESKATEAAVSLVFAGETEAKLYTFTPGAFNGGVVASDLGNEDCTFKGGLSGKVVKVTFKAEEITKIELAEAYNTTGAVKLYAVGANFVVTAAGTTYAGTVRYAENAAVVELQKDTGAAKTYGTTQAAYYKPVELAKAAGYELSEAAVYVEDKTSRVALVVYNFNALEDNEAEVDVVTIAAFVNKYTQLDADGETVYYAQYKTMGTDTVVTYEVTSGAYDAMRFVGNVYKLTLDGSEVDAYDQYILAEAAVVKAGASVTTAAITVGAAKIKSNTLVISQAAVGTVAAIDVSVELDETVAIYEYVAGAVDRVEVATADDVVEAKSVCAYDVDGNGLVDLILLNTFTEAQYITAFGDNASA